jgi:hypothetical protein
MKEKFSTSKLLAIVLCLQLASVAITVIDGLFYNDAWLGWIQRGITVAVIVCFIRLSMENRLYRWTAVLKAVALGLMLIGLLLSNNFVIYGFYEYLGITVEDLFVVSSVVYWMRMAATLPANILEYLSHGKVAPAVRKGWIVFMIANLAWIVAGNAISRIAEVQVNAQLISAEVLYAISDGFQVINLVFQMAYLWFLFKTYQAVRKRTEK